jgi:aspartate racemase
VVQLNHLKQLAVDFFFICTNTMYKLVSQVSDAVSIPLLQIVDAKVTQLLSDNISSIGPFGTLFTMQQAFYKNRLIDKFSIDVLVRTQIEQDIIQHVIYQELCVGSVVPNSRKQYEDVIKNLTQRGAQGIILGCTEIGLQMNENNTSTTLYDTH